ncbi:MAG: alpha/beta hydrolase [Thermodesulfobacteriota bacterium]
MQRRDLTVDGARVAVYESGAGEPCLLLHGYPQSHWCWRRVAPALAASHRVVAVDWFGWGASERSLRLAPAYDDEVARLASLLDALGLERVNLLAHDYGAFLALGFAVRAPERLLRLAVLNSRAHRTFPLASYAQFGLLSLLGRAAPRAFRSLPLYEAHRRSFAPYVRNGSFSRDDVERYLGFLRTVEGRLWLGHFFAHYSVAVRPGLAAGCSTIDVPAAVVWGDADPYCPFATAEDLAARLRRSRLTRLPGADHYVMEERPAEVTAALRALLARPAA